MKLKRMLLSDLAFMVIMVVLALLSVYSYQRINDLNNQFDGVNHSNLIKLILKQTLSHIRDAETRQRFFLLTRDSTYLLPDNYVMEENDRNLHKLDSLTKDNPLLQQHVKQLSVLTKKRLQRLSYVSRTLPGDTAGIRKTLAMGKMTMDEIISALASMESIEDKLLAERSNNKDSAVYNTPLTSQVLSAFAILIVGFTYLFLRTQTRLRFNAEDDIKKLNDYFKDLPAVFAIVKGPSHIHEISNRLYDQLTGDRLLKGKSYKEAFPEGQQILDKLDEVYRSGEPYFGKETPLSIKAPDGSQVTGYFNFTYKPLFNRHKQIEGLLIFGYEITETIESRKKLEQAEQQSRLAIEAANIGIFDWDMEHNIFATSGRLLEIFGFSANEDVPHQSLVARFHPEDKPLRDKAVADSYTRGALSYEARITWPDGSRHWVSVYGKTNFSAGREALRMYGTVIDVTEQKKALEELKENEEKFRLLADSMPQFVWTADIEGKFDYFNKAVYNHGGLRDPKVKEQGLIAIVHPDERKETIRKWAISINTGKDFIVEHRICDEQGSYRWQLSRAIPQRDPSGAIQRWVGTSTDIQDQKDYAQRLEQEIMDRTLQLRELNRSLLIKNNIFAQAEENALIGSYSWNLQTGELEYSDNLFRLFGYEPGEFVPSFKKYLSMIHPDDKDQVMRDGMETMALKKLAAHVYRIITKDGQVKSFRSTGRILGEAENAMLIGTVQDISQDIMLSEMLRIRNIQLERSNADLESFNYIASHDLQEPLRKIQAFSERILQKEGANFSAFTRDYFSRINSSAARMQNLINALLSYSRADATFKQRDAVDLNILMENVRNEMQELIDEKNAQLETGNLPVINAVAMQVHQLFMNLIGNAVKYSKAGVPPRIKVNSSLVKGTEIGDTTADRNMLYHKLSVLDNGIGFEQKYQHKIFELFQRLHNGDNYKGTGIGLAICKKIMVNHGGFISATGVAGIGSEFKVYFPHHHLATGHSNNAMQNRETG